MAAINTTLKSTFELISFEGEDWGVDEGGSQGFPLNLADHLDKSNWSFPVFLSAK